MLVQVKAKGQGAARDVVVQPFNMMQDAELRYHEWEYTRRLAVEQKSEGKIGYVHLRAMGANDMDQWTEEYLPVFTRDGLIIDVRHNNGGNIDSWILGRLMRKAWMYWQARVGMPNWNMQQAFRGHMVVLCDQMTASDGEAFTEGFRRLGLGKVIGMRTWGGEVWLSANNFLADKGIATTGENGVFGPEGKWLITKGAASSRTWRWTISPTRRSKGRTPSWKPRSSTCSNRFETNQSPLRESPSIRINPSVRDLRPCPAPEAANAVSNK